MTKLRAKKSSEGRFKLLALAISPASRNCKKAIYWLKRPSNDMQRLYSLTALSSFYNDGICVRQDREKATKLDAEARKLNETIKQEEDLLKGTVSKLPHR